MGSCPDTDTDPALLTPFLSVLLLLHISIIVKGYVCFSVLRKPVFKAI